MFRCCRAGRNAWQVMSAPARGSLQRAASAWAPAEPSATTTEKTVVVTKTTTTTTTTTTVIEGPPIDADGAQPSQHAAGAVPSPSTSTSTTTSSSSTNPRPISPVQGRYGSRDEKGAAQAKPDREYRKVIFSGIQPTGIPHLGNYLGALREWKRLQDKAEADTLLLFCIVDLHAITVPRPREQLVQDRRQMLASLLAIGLRDDASNLFFQSAMPYHTELQWILSCTASMGYLSRMTQWKSKMKLADDASLDSPAARKTLKHGLFSYPILQAADILLYGTTHVPVGEDQRQHLEFARECVSNFNHTYKTDCLVAPQTLISPSKRIMSLSNPTQKMSKSDPSPKSRILITDSPEEIAKKIRHAVTDSNELVTYDPANRPGVANLIEILASFDPRNRQPGQLADQMKGHKVAELKQVVAQVLSDELAEIRDRYNALMSRPERLFEATDRGTQVARMHAEQTMTKVREAVGLEPLQA